MEGKVIVIGGCPRAGKTTLSVKLVKSGLGFSKISMDYFGEAMNAGLHKYEGIAKDDFEVINTLLDKLVYDAEAYGINSIFDYCGYDFPPEDMEKLSFKDKLDIYFFGFSDDISADEIKYTIKHYAKPTDWISYVDDDYIGKVSKRIYEFNKELKKQCEKYNYRFINTGVGEKREIILNSLYDEIIASCSK